MGVVVELLVVDSRYEAAGHCLVCGGTIGEGEGLTAAYHGRILRFRCPRCLERFAADPERYLANHPDGCCIEDRGDSPASEWGCD